VQVQNREVEVEDALQRKRFEMSRMDA
jgi:hypothetical protein